MFFDFRKIGEGGFEVRSAAIGECRPSSFDPVFDYASPVSENENVVYLRSWACGAAGSALPWHGRGRRFDPDQVHQISFSELHGPPARCRSSLDARILFAQGEGAASEGS
jgi:hypothetical protein